MHETVVRLISFVGTGNYQPVTYQWRDDPTARVTTNLMTDALAQLLKPAEVICLATKQAEDKWRADLEQRVSAETGLTPRFRMIPTGQTERELWDIFDVCREELAPVAQSGPFYLDITHGFRHQPLIAGAVSAFRTLTQNPQDNARNPVRIVYGAFEAKNDEDVAPIFDVTPFLDIVDWAQAIMMFLRTGRVGDLAALTQEAGGRAGRTWTEGGKQGPSPGLSKLHAPLRAFGLDLATVRTGALFLGDGTSGGSAARLVNVIDTILPSLAQDQKALASVIGDLRAMAADLVLPDGVDTLADPRAKQAAVNLAERYLTMERYSEAASTAREGMVSLFAPPTAGRPGPSFDASERADAEERWRADMGNEARRDGGIRNDLLHAGFNDSPLRGQKVARQIEGLVERFSAIAIPDSSPRADTPPDPSTAVFLNISNHRLEDWEPAQTQAAQALAPNLDELDFPNVDPDADEDAIMAEVEKLEATIPPETTHAMVQGEFTLTFALVRRLQARGITCLAATTHRDVITEPDGSRRYRFRFHRFRSYGDPP